MITIKDNHQHLARCVILERMVLPVYPEKTKTRRMRADLEDRWNVAWRARTFLSARFGAEEERETKDGDSKKVDSIFSMPREDGSVCR